MFSVWREIRCPASALSCTAEYDSTPLSTCDGLATLALTVTSVHMFMCLGMVSIWENFQSHMVHFLHSGAIFSLRGVLVSESGRWTGRPQS